MDTILIEMLSRTSTIPSFLSHNLLRASIRHTWAYGFTPSSNNLASSINRNGMKARLNQ